MTDNENPRFEAHTEQYETVLGFRMVGVEKLDRVLIVKAVRASSKEIPCLAALVFAFLSSHSKRNSVTRALYIPKGANLKGAISRRVHVKISRWQGQNPGGERPRGGKHPSGVQCL